MSSPEDLPPVVVSAQELLAFNEDRLVRLLNESRTRSGGFDISRVVGVDGLSKDQREAFSKKLSAAAIKAGSLDTNELSRLLNIFAGHVRTGDVPTWSQNRHARSPTSSPLPEGNSRFEAFCYDELVRAGGRPAISIEPLLHAPSDAEVDKRHLGPWLDDRDSCNRDGDVPSVFSEQLADWTSFQHKWQWDNRGKIESEEGFSAFLESCKRKYLRKGESEVVSDASFEETVRQEWKYESRFLEQSGRDGFTAYTRAVEKRLLSHKFTQPFQLAEDPRQQDARTTWVEYLNYVYWWQDRYAAEMKAAEPRYRKAWDELLSSYASLSANTSTTSQTFGEELSMTRNELDATRQQIRKFIRDTKKYQRAEKHFCRQQLRAEWALEQLTLIEETAPSLEHEAAREDSSGRSNKRKLRSDHDVLSLKRPKRKRQEISCSSSIPDPEVQPGNGVGPRRSQRRRIDAAPEALLSKPQASVPRTRKGPRQKETQERSHGFTASQSSRLKRQKPKGITSPTR